MSRHARAATRALACFDAHDAWAADAGIPPAARETAPYRADLALGQGHRDEAEAIVTDLHGWLEQRQGQVSPSDAARWFVCHRVLTSTGSPAAGDMLRRAHELVMLHADKLDAPERAAYLENLSLHRKIEVAWALTTHTPASFLPSGADG